MPFKLILTCAISFALIASAANSFAEDKADSVVPPPDTVTIKCDTLPKFVREVEPTYPVLAKEGGFKAYVEIRALVDTTGKIVMIDWVTDRRNMGFEKVSIDAARASQFAPPP